MQKKLKISAATSKKSGRTSEPKQGFKQNVKDQATPHERGSRGFEEPRSILKKKGHTTDSSLKQVENKSKLGSSVQPAKVPRDIGAQRSGDDAEIAALEKALGLNKDGVLPKSFAEDGLDLLLDGLDGSPVDNPLPIAKRKQPADEEWLRRKRQKALHPDSSSDRTGEELASGHSSDGDSMHSQSLKEDELISGDEESGSLDSSSERSCSPNPSASKIRENPYRPPVVSLQDQPTPKYIPPSLRAKDPSTAEDLTLLRRQLQGLLNRLSDANLLSILREVENIYRCNPRQLVSTTLLDLLVGLLCDPTSLQDTFIILHAGFIAGLYKIMGTDFGAQAIQQIDNAFVEHYESERKEGGSGRRSANLVSLLAQLYTFQVISSNLIYDFIRLFLDDVTEMSAELVLKIMRSKSQIDLPCFGYDVPSLTPS